MTKKSENRWRCLVTGCNPKLYGQQAATDHRDATGHRVAKWPVRSPEGQRKARERNRNGYYDKYNVGAKSRHVRQMQAALANAPETPLRRTYGCLNPSEGGAFTVGGEFGGFEYSENCGDCSWCEENGIDGYEDEYAFGEDDF